MQKLDVKFLSIISRGNSMLGQTIQEREAAAQAAALAAERKEAQRVSRAAKREAAKQLREANRIHPVVSLIANNGSEEFREILINFTRNLRRSCKLGTPLRTMFKNMPEGKVEWVYPQTSTFCILQVTRVNKVKKQFRVSSPEVSASLAWYILMKIHGPKHVEKILDFIRQEFDFQYDDSYLTSPRYRLPSDMYR
ncbi:MAG: hypothetical protein PHQ75_02055 [Thermoguttaceae bacterium]|nr:hypothetical protein [Thermoguttaceae bacterium]